MGFFNAFFGCIIYWKYYLEEKGPERDTKILKVAKNGNIISSHCVVAICFGGLFAWLAFLSPLFYSLVLTLAFIFYCTLAIHFICQISIHFDEIKRISGIKSFRKDIKEGFLFVKDITNDLIEGMAYDFEKMLEEFFYGYKKDEEYRYYEHVQDIEDEDDHVATIFMKYDLALDSDMETIKKRFRILAKKYHPDMPTGDEKKFIDLREDLSFLTEYTKLKMSA